MAQEGWRYSLPINARRKIDVYECTRCHEPGTPLTPTDSRHFVCSRCRRKRSQIPVEEKKAKERAVNQVFKPLLEGKTK